MKFDDAVIPKFAKFFMAILLLIIATFYAFGYLLPEDRALWGQFGDFVGGTLNPILTFLTFCVVLATLYFQRTELIESRREMKRSADALEAQIREISEQKFEASFFQLLTLLNIIVNSIDLRVPGGRTGALVVPGYDIRGRDCFREHFIELGDLYREERRKNPSERISDLETIRIVYEQFWDRHRQDLGHYFRFIYNIIRLIDQKNTDNKIYSRIFRAQLSDYELVLIFYNCQTHLGEKLKHLVEKTALLNNMPVELLFHECHVNLFGRGAYMPEGE